MNAVHCFLPHFQIKLLQQSQYKFRSTFLIQVSLKHSSCARKHTHGLVLLTVLFKADFNSYLRAYEFLNHSNAIKPREICHRRSIVDILTGDD